MAEYGKYILYAGIATAVVVGGYYIVKDVFGNTSCAYVGSACNTATAPYIQAYQNCANTYASQLQQYLAQNNQAGTGLQNYQLSNLQYLTNCMNMNAQAILKAAEATNPSFLTEAGLVLQNIALPIAAVAAAAVGAKALFQSIPDIIKTVRSGSGVSSALNATMTQDAATTGTITNSSAAAENLSFESVQPTLETGAGQFFADAETAGVMDAVDVAESTTVDQTAIQTALGYISTILNFIH